LSRAGFVVWGFSFGRGLELRSFLHCRLGPDQVGGRLALTALLHRDEKRQQRETDAVDRGKPS
jgi:hypothetical protein